MPDLPFLVVITTTPFIARAPYKAVADASFKISIVSISLRIKTSHRRTKQCSRITTRKLIVGDINDIFKHYTIYYPKRFIFSINRSGAANMDLWCRTKCSRNILNRYTGRTTLPAFYLRPPLLEF